MNKYQCTESGWFLLCPIYLAYDETGFPIPIPRLKFLYFWFDLMLGIQQGINWILSFVVPEAGGFMCWGIKELDEEIEIEI